MAIVSHYHKPDLFITMIYNPNWPEVKDNLLPGQTPQDKPNLVARVFHSRKKQFIQDLIKDYMFGLPVAHLQVI